MSLQTSILGVESELPIYATPVARMGMGQELVRACGRFCAGLKWAAWVRG